MSRKKLLVKLSLSFLILSVGIILIITYFIHQWSHQAEGVLPSKTAVILHAINERLVTLDMEPPALLRGDGVAPFTRESLMIPVTYGAEIPIRIYRPSGEGPFPVILYYHGGAFLEGFGNIDTHDNIARYLTLHSNSIIITVGYRLAPSYIFPTAIEDSYDALIWTEKYISSWGGDPTKIAVAGDSAGGNIATVVTIMAKDREGPKINGQVLFYPLTTFQEIPLTSRDIYADGYYLLSEAVMAYARDAYTPESWMWHSAYTSPLHAEDLSGLPPALIISAEFDPLRDEAELYGELLYQNGVPVQLYRFDGVMHAFISFYEIMHKGRFGLQLAVTFLDDLFNDNKIKEVYPIQKVSYLNIVEQLRDNTEAYIFAGYLLWKKFIATIRNETIF